MVRLYYGKIGGGKTYLVLFQEIIPALRDGRKIITNIDGLDIPAIRNYIGRDVDIKVIKSHKWWQNECRVDVVEDGEREGDKVLGPALEAGALYVVDECQFIWDSRNFKDTKKGFSNLLEYNRHFGIDLIFITQNAKRAETNISRLANDSYQVKNLGFILGALSKKYVVNRRQTPFDKDVISQYKGAYDPAIYSLYRSGVDASKSSKGGTAFSSPWWFAGLTIGVVCLVAVISSGNPLKKIGGSMKGVKNEGVLGKRVGLGDGLQFEQVGSGQVVGAEKKETSIPESVKRIAVGQRFTFNEFDCEYKGYGSWVDGLEVNQVDFHECGGRLYHVAGGVIVKSILVKSSGSEAGGDSLGGKSSVSFPAGMTVDDLKGPSPAVEGVGVSGKGVGKES